MVTDPAREVPEASQRTAAGPARVGSQGAPEEAKSRRRGPRPSKQTMRASPSTAARQTMSALEMGDLDADAFGQAPVSLRFRHGPLEDRYRSYRARRARELGATPWVTRLGMLVARVLADVVDGLARKRSWHRYELLATGLFGICVVALYFASRHIKIASGDGSYEVVRRGFVSGGPAGVQVVWRSRSSATSGRDLII